MAYKFLKLLLVAMGLSFLSACGGGGGTDTNSVVINEPESTPPLITSFQPTTGAPGDRIIIEGLLFSDTTSGNQVFFNGVAAMVIDASSNSLLVTVPEGATTGSITVANDQGQSTSVESFTLSGISEPAPIWQTRLSAPRSSRLLANLAWSGERYVAVGNGCWFSEDTKKWSVSKLFTCDINDVVWDGSQFVGVGDNGGVYRSSTGEVWSGGWSDLSDPDLTGVAFAGETYVAVGSQGAILRSMDRAVTWEWQVSGTTNDLASITWDGGQFVAVGEGGTILTSTDGVSWQAQDSGTENRFFNVEFGGGLLVASGAFANSSEPAVIMTSTDGVTWVERANYLVDEFAFGNDLWVGVALGRTVVSTDGVTWTEYIDNSASPISVIYADNQFLSMSVGGAVYSSADGRRWQLLVSQTNLGVSAVSPNGDLVVAVAGYSSTVSLDNGVSWSTSRLSDPGSPYFLNVVWSPLLNQFLSLGQHSANYKAYTSQDGENWQVIDHAPTYPGLVSSDTILVSAGANLLGSNYIYTSVDGVDWTERNNPSEQRIMHVTWTGNKFIVLGEGGDVVMSNNGIDWQLHNVGESTPLTAAALGANALVVVGWNGAIFVSNDDGDTWQQSDSTVTSRLNAVTWTSDEFVAVGRSGVVLRSADGVTWTQVPNPYEDAIFGLDPYSLNGLLWSGSRLVVFGDDGLIATTEL